MLRADRTIDMTTLPPSISVQTMWFSVFDQLISFCANNETLSVTVKTSRSRARYASNTELRFFLGQEWIDTPSITRILLL